MVAAAAASLATSAPRSVRRYPTWRSEPEAQVVDGALVRAWVSRSGREGAGISVEIDPRGSGLSFAIDPAATTLRFSRRTIHARRVLPAPAPPERVRFYLPMRFDGQTAWNTGDRRALLRLAIRSPAGTRTVLVWLSHSLVSPHAWLDAPTSSPRAPR